ncbi:ABC transporter ATP-binding protein [Aquamicrobium sp. NLF2-7]|uniref:ABC transporter ATP-binding protein n=1 Tax=Aquamicrobium sp. NLF2-7 TaxID=2918753 RepID=UPI001EFB59AA|nr:ABC transporter ATP-binding protein [Aquamicrobium sp. NLF2-7]MCG8273860.1 ABC transporter ATP-binding protein [Aquamicrobium sp. NLF2-7]
MLHLDNVSFRYPDAAAGVLDVSLEVKPGELVAVIGASGSGKTTLLNLLAGFLAPGEGRVVIDGEDVSALPPERRNLGIVFQSYGLFPHMRAWENVAYPLKVRGVSPAERQARARDALQRVGMANRADNGPRELSGGQQQRVALARALVFEPRGLLLDEPLSALDANLRVEMRDEILRVQRAAGIATLLVTHDQEEALSIADRVAVMRDGRLVQIAPPRELYDAPADEETARFVGEANLWRGAVVAPGRVSTPVGILACDTQGRETGSAVVVLVRPENVVPLAGAGDKTPNAFTGSVVADRFLGSARRLDLAVADGSIRLETRIRDAIGGVAIPPEAIRLLSPTNQVQ